MEKRRFGRDISGVLLLDKPSGITSNKILQQIKKMVFAKKAGHTGSLDPLATGLLPICFGEATKFSNYLLNADKKYLMVCKLGITTTSADADGEILQIREVASLSSRVIIKHIKKFLGKIYQIPPMHSAIKINGEALYKKAHRGETIVREARLVQVYEFNFISLKDDLLTLEASCSKGTYVRTLVEDLGEELGCGAHVVKLHRSQVGEFTADEMVTFTTIEKCFNNNDDFASLNNLIISTSEMLRGLPKINLDSDQKFYLLQGQALRVSDSPKSGAVSVFAGNQFLGVAEVLEDGRIEPKRLLR